MCDYGARKFDNAKDLRLHMFEGRVGESLRRWIDAAPKTGKTETVPELKSFFSNFLEVGAGTVFHDDKEIKKEFAADKIDQYQYKKRTYQMEINFVVICLQMMKHFPDYFHPNDESPKLFMGHSANNWHRSFELVRFAKEHVRKNRATKVAQNKQKLAANPDADLPTKADSISWQSVIEIEKNKQMSSRSKWKRLFYLTDPYCQAVSESANPMLANVQHYVT